MSTPYNQPFEIHVHGEVPLRPEVSLSDLEDGLKPLWKYAGARSFKEGVTSLYEEEPGILIDAQEHKLQMCWTVRGGEDFRHVLDELCMNLNELASVGAPIEVTFYDSEYDDEDDEDDEGEEESESRDDFVMLFVGPTPAAIMQVQRDLLVQDVVNVMERHFDASQLSGVVDEIDKLFAARFDSLVHSLDLGKTVRPGSSTGGHGGGRRPRHLH